MYDILFLHVDHSISFLSMIASVFERERERERENACPGSGIAHTGALYLSTDLYLGARGCVSE